MQMQNYQGASRSQVNDVACTRLLELFEAYSDRQFVFVEPGGNAGDYLIYRGAEKLAGQAGLHYETVSHSAFMEAEFSENTVVYLHGSGGFNPWWSGTPMRALSKASAGHEGIFIIGPSTFYNDAAFLKDTVVAPLQEANFERLCIFTREMVSYDALKELLPSHVELAHDHDTALNVAPDDLIDSTHSHPWTLYGIRKDKEAKEIKSPHPLLFWVDPPQQCPEFDTWATLHASVGRVVTNRLHSSIASAVFGKQTTLLPNSYFKNRAVWEYSLEARGVEWREELPEISSSYPSILKSLLPNSVIQRIVNKYYLSRVVSQ